MQPWYIETFRNGDGHRILRGVRAMAAALDYRVVVNNTHHNSNYNLHLTLSPQGAQVKLSSIHHIGFS